jgi:type I restriction enzyme R subunit
VIVIADEAHRSQYRKFAGNVRDALPNAGFLGITGTPIELSDRSTQAVFGKLISAYPIQRSVEDKATVPIYYEGRLVPLHLTNDFIDDEYDELVSEFSSDVQEKTKRKLSRLAGLIGTPDRLEKIAQDIIQHFNSRPVEGKAMVVTVSRQVAVDLYNIMTKIPGAPEMAVVISNSEEFQGKIQSELNNHVLEENFKNNGHSLKMAIVCDMWLTGFDVPSLNTMYIDKPLKNHTLMQAIARVNRVFKDKPGGLIVDYIGIADDLKKALSIYSSDVRKEALIPLEEIINKMRVKYDEVRGMLADVSYSNWKDLKGAELSGLIGLALDVLVDKPDGKNRFVDLVGALSRMFALAMPHEEARQIIQDVEFFQALRQIILKQLVVGIGGVGVDIESAIRDLVSKNIAAEGVIDIFGSKGTAKPEISIFDEKFIEQIKKTHLKNLAAETLRKLLEDELRGRRRQNDIRYASLADILRDIIEKYENGIINSSQVIEELLKLAKDVQSAADEGKKLGLSEEELAFYDAIVVAKKSDLKEGPLKELVRELVQLIRRDLSVDWTSSDIIKSKIRANVRLLLLQRGIIVKEEENLIERILNQAITLYRDLIPART